MAELQCLDKPDCVNNCAQLVDHFVNKTEQKYGRKDKVRLIFNRYDVVKRNNKREEARRLGRCLLSDDRFY